MFGANPKAKLSKGPKTAAQLKAQANAKRRLESNPNDTSIEGTQDYLHMTAELYPEIVSRSDAAFSDVIPRRTGRPS